MDIRIVTLFPEMFDGPFKASIVARAIRDGRLDLSVHQLRDYTTDRHRTVDDTPYGGGPGMVMKAPPLFTAVEDLKRQEAERGVKRVRVVLLSAQGRRFSQEVAKGLAGEECLILVCGHYEGVDERVIEHLVDDEICIGDYVLTGGEPAAIVLVDAVTRLLPGALGSPDSAPTDSFTPALRGGLQGPVYTRPAEFRGWTVPDILLSGDHARIEDWRRTESEKRTRARRPDLLDDAGPSATDRR